MSFDFLLSSRNDVCRRTLQSIQHNAYTQSRFGNFAMLRSERGRKESDIQVRAKEQRYVCVCASILNLIFLQQLRVWMLPVNRRNEVNHWVRWNYSYGMVEHSWKVSQVQISIILFSALLKRHSMFIFCHFSFRCCYDIMPSQSNPFAWSDACKSCIDCIWRKRMKLKKEPKIQSEMFHISFCRQSLKQINVFYY